MTTNLYLKIIAEHSKEDAIKRLFSFVEVKCFSVNYLKIICICNFKAPRADKSHARHGDAIDAVKLFLFLTAFIYGHGAVEVFAFVEIILLSTPYHAVKLALGLGGRIIIPIAAEIVNIRVFAPHSGSVKVLQGDTFQSSADELLQHSVNISVVKLLLTDTGNRSRLAENECEIEPHQIIHDLVKLLFLVVPSVDRLGLLNSFHVEKYLQL